MHTFYDIRDFIIATLPADKKEQFLAEVNEILKDDVGNAVLDQADYEHEARGLTKKDFFSEASLEAEWERWIDGPGRRNAVLDFGVRWYSGGVPARSGRFVIKNLFKAKRVRYRCEGDLLT